MSENRAHRAALTSVEAAAALRVAVRAGRLDGDAAAAVLTAVGQTAPSRRSWPDGLTPREVEVLGLLAKGGSNKLIADQLTITPKTVANHVEHLYTKIGATSRAAATLYAMQHGLVGAYQTHAG